MSDALQSPLLDRLPQAGGVPVEYHGRRLVRHFGDPAAEYSAATDGVAVFDRSHRSRLTVSGRAPGQMLQGVLTGTIPAPPLPSGDDVVSGVATYHAVLTTKGKMVTDLWALLPGEEAAPGFVFDVPVAGVGGLTGHLAKYLPPRLAAVADVSAETAMITVVGREAADVVSRLGLGLRVGADTLRKGVEGAWWRIGSYEDGLTVMRTEEVWPDAYSVLGAVEPVAGLWSRLVDDGAVPAGLGVWSTLRVEAGRPAFGTDMDDNTIPIEAGIHDRAIDYTKGCYTGQEVIVRIRDRGHVNRHLRLLDLGDVPAPAHGAELFVPGDDAGKAVGHVTSAVQSPRTGGALALAYVRRGVETVTLDGREVTVPTE